MSGAIQSMIPETFGITSNEKAEMVQQIQITPLDKQASNDQVVMLLNKVFGHTWSFEAVDVKHLDEMFVAYHGRLTIPGFGIREAYGQAEGTDIKAAEEDALRQCALKVGFGSRTPDPRATVETASAVETPEVPVRPEVQSKRKIPVTVEEKAKELKNAYDIKSKAQFVAFAKIWNPTIQSFSDIDDTKMEQLHAYVEANHVEFEDFVAGNH